MGFVALMSWMSDYIDSNTKAGYTLPTGPHTYQKINKTLYCDDSAIAANSKQERNELLTLVCKFMEAVEMEINYEKTSPSPRGT